MLRHRAALKLAAPLFAYVLAASACDVRDAPRPESSRGASVTSAPAAAPPSSLPNPPPELPLACATLREVSVSDVVRIDGATMFYADAASGLTIVDVADASRPRQVAVVPFVGVPLSLFVREGTAWLVFIDSDGQFIRGKVATVVRAVDVRVPSRPRIIGELAREGTALDAKLVGGFLYLMRGTADRTVVESFGLRSGALRALDTVDIRGAPAQLAASSAGLGAVTVDDDHSTVAWIDLPLDQPGALLLREAVRVQGGVATWERGERRIVDADDGQRVRLVTCATRSCGPSEAATLRVVDFGTQATARVGPSLRLTEHGGLPITRFADELLYIAETSLTSRGGAVLHVVLTEDRGPRFVSHLPLRGMLSGLVPRDGSLVALGTVESAESASSIVIHDIDVRKPSAPRLRSTVSFGSDWTWSVALDDEAALSFDPSSQLVGIPFTAWRQADKRLVTGTQLVELGPYGGQSAVTIPADGYVERAIFLDGHLVTIGPSGVAAFDYASVRRHDLAERGVDLGR